MNLTSPDFYLASSEGHMVGGPRMCFRVKRVRYGNRDDCLLVQLKPPLDGRNYGMVGKEIDQIVLATRFNGDTLFPPSRWPLEVYVLRFAVDNEENLDAFENQQLINIAWGELYQNQEQIPPADTYQFGS